MAADRAFESGGVGLDGCERNVWIGHVKIESMKDYAATYFPGVSAARFAEREGPGVRARQAGSVTREEAARLHGAARSRGAMPARRTVWLTVTRWDATILQRQGG